MNIGVHPLARPTISDPVAGRITAALFAGPVVVPVVVCAFVYSAPLWANPEPSAHLMSIPVYEKTRALNGTASPKLQPEQRKEALTTSVVPNALSPVHVQAGGIPTHPRIITLSRIDDVNGVTLISERFKITLGGIEELQDNESCMRLDGVREPCTLRVKARIHALTAGALVTCDLHDSSSQNPTGSCRVGRRDLAKDLVRSGLARLRKNLTSSN
jgi:endonuclease YncB( thermonuclease family)